ncbi:MAG: hydroxysqualene dehydroxylase HpnE [Chromatiales bacterium]|nr:hydroxysqualene dehydroxylase HpnE [Chromatiales bacterium]
MAKTVIVGAGWAGLAAAIELTRQGVPVTVIESAKACGGRARKIDYRGAQFDNGQHILIGAYREIFRLLKICGVDPQQVLQRAPLHFTFYGDGRKQRSIQLPRLPAPIHMAAGILQAKGMAWSTKWQLISASLRFLLRGFKLKSDCSVTALLQQAGQTESTIKALWEPLCIATLNTPPNIASAEIFLRVLKDAFTQSYRDSDTILSKVDLSTLFVEPAIRYIRAHGGEVLTSTRIKAIEINEKGITAALTDSMRIEAKNIILATPPPQTAQLLKPHAQLHPLVESLQRFEYQPIITLYLQYSEATRLPHPFVAFDDALTQWLFDRDHCGQPGLMAAVISAEGEHRHWSRTQITDQVKEEIAAHFPHLGDATESWLIHEKRATFAATVGSNAYRPTNQTSTAGLWLAGDYTDTGYPATLEGAIISGVASAHGLLSDNIRK